jgi:3-hydroxyisobutyrate dehydrogenase-like beta-hydroxyacid dehydrogenase
MSRRTRNNVGIIGLGIIGQRVADNLRRRGFHVYVWNRTPRAVPNFVGSRAEVAELCDFVQIFVSDDEALLQSVQQLTPALTPRHIVLAHSTVAPETMRTAAEIVQRRGARFLDAPFTGSKPAAEKGELIYYVGGDEAALRDARAVLSASSKEIIAIGEVGQATTIKIATNMITAASVQAAGEALALVQNSGLSAEKLMTALQSNASHSPTLAFKLPKMIAGDYAPQFSVKHMFKDMQLAYRLGRSHDLEFGVTGAARDALLDEIRKGHEDADYTSAVRKFFPEREAQNGSVPELFDLQANPAPEPVVEKIETPAAPNIILGGQIDVAALFAALPTSAPQEPMPAVVQTEEQPVGNSEENLEGNPEEDLEEHSQERGGFFRRLLRGD